MKLSYYHLTSGNKYIDTSTPYQVIGQQNEEEPIQFNSTDKRFVSDRYLQDWDNWIQTQQSVQDFYTPRTESPSTVSSRQTNREVTHHSSSPQDSNNDNTDSSDNIDSVDNTVKTFSQLLQEEGINARITSAYRPGAKTSNGSASHHSNKDNPAVDIVPTNGKSFDQLAIELITNPRIMQWFKNNKWGIHSEVTKDQWNAFTTGAHFHIGPDRVAQKGLQAIVKNYNEGKTDIWKYQLS